ncbi:hypothetical protein CC86DRAFT_365446 [Ophiobolus disseminans]|uniref:RAD52 homolog n=1 Tax=Ophiobolus disseminans TaxID=1469910 RepID=A0A6A7AK29_9PLEO|nr:hypothetical protein CC86DRAFT_365446 [Ophiobolus disseminans]
MPALGDQYYGGTVTNPFEERVVNHFTANEIATLQSRLNKQLGPEYISTRPGAGGGKVAYLEGNKAIALANEVFGFNGWSSSLGQVQIDYVDEHQNQKVSLGLSIVVRITLKDGTYHEDIGYGSIENGKGKAASFEKAKKEAATDGLKRALRTFGNVLGNCLYDKNYLKKVQAMSVKPIKFEEGNLYRHPDFALPPQECQAVMKHEPQRTPIRPNQVLRTRTEHLGQSFNGEFDDDFDGNLFDGVDVAESRRNESSFDTASAPTEPAPRAIEATRAGNGSNQAPSARTSPIRHTGPPQQPPQRMQAANARNGNGQGGAQQPRPNQGPGKLPPNASIQRQPQTPAQLPNQPRPDQNRGRMAPPTADIHASKPPIQQQQQNPQQEPQAQPLRQTPPEQQAPNQPRPAAQAQGTTTPSANVPPPNGRPPLGFITSRAAEMLQGADGTGPINHLPTFDPNVESPVPKDKRTPGIDHRRSAAVKRQEVGAPPAPAPAAQPANSRTSGGAGRPTNFTNPQQDMSRRIGMPGGPGYAMSPSANRGSAYKPPTFANGAAAGVKRERAPLQDVSNQGANGSAGEGSDVKRQRIEAPGTENTAGGAMGS